jgi:hypothetical protein
LHFELFQSFLTNIPMGLDMLSAGDHSKLEHEEPEEINEEEYEVQE